MNRPLVIVILLVGLLACQTPAEQTTPGNPPGTQPPVAAGSLIHRDGSRLLLNGVAFGNEVWTDDRRPAAHPAPQRSRF